MDAISDPEVSERRIAAASPRRTRVAILDELTRRPSQTEGRGDPSRALMQQLHQRVAQDHRVAQAPPPERPPRPWADREAHHPAQLLVAENERLQARWAGSKRLTRAGMVIAVRRNVSALLPKLSAGGAEPKPGR
jgi:hypothetical protein